jgi:hypothetical protein
MPISISLDEYWFAVGGGDEGSEGGTGGGIAPVVWAMTDVDAKMIEDVGLWSLTAKLQISNTLHATHRAQARQLDRPKAAQ